MEQYRQLFGLSHLLENNTVEEALKESPECFLPCMKLINQAFEGSGKHTFALVPLTRKFRPGFVTLDTTTWQEILGLPLMDTKKTKINARIRERRKEKANGTYVSKKEKSEAKKAEHNAAKEERKIAKRKREEEFKAMNESKQQKTIRKEKERQEREEIERQNRLRKQANKDVDAAAKDEYFSSFLNIRINAKRDFRFAHNIRTDGISARLLFTKTVRRTKVVSVRRNVKRGLYTIDQLKHLSRLSIDNMEIIGIDPGMYDLIHAVGDNYLNDCSKRLKYSAAQRRHERCSTFYIKRCKR